MSKDIVRVLLVEDSPSDARLLCAALEDYPLQRFEIERAERLSEALAFLGQKSCDVILLDLNLPDSSGLETCAPMSRAAGPVPIIILTGAEDETVAAEAMRLGIQDYLVKGRVYGSMIGRTIRYTVERSQSQQALRESNATLESKVMQRTAELKHRTRQLQKLTLEMSEAEDRERDRLAHILHDDLQQELAAAKFHLSIVRNQIRQDSSLHDLTARIDEMLKDAIAKSRSLSHELSPAVLHQDHLAEIFHWLADEMQAKHGLTVRVHGQARCLSHPIRSFLYRTAQELLFNAVKHAQVGEARVRVRPWGGYLGLAVSDRGRGFDPERLRETAGFGLLSIRERIELIGGRMKIRSAPGRGSTFIVVVPNSEEVVGSRTSVAGEEKTPADRRLPTTGYRLPLRVVLADDHQVVRQGLASLFREEETIEVVGEATNGREAVDLANQLHPDVVIMDVSMPVLGGEEATRRIKKDLPQTRIVSLSMWDEPEVRERMYEAGAESYVLKTAPAEELLAAIRGGANPDPG